MRKIFLIFLLITSNVTFAQNHRIISVDGTGAIEIYPDIIRIKYIIISIHPTESAKAKLEVDTISNNSVNALIKLGVSENDITSSSIDVGNHETYDKYDNPVISGKIVSREIDVNIRDIKKYNIIIQSLIKNKVTEINSVKADVSNYEELKKKALASAALNAKNNAKFLAQQFDAELGKVHTIGKQRIRRNNMFLEEVVVTARKTTLKDILTPYEFKPGKIKISSEVYVEFEIQ